MKIDVMKVIQMSAVDKAELIAKSGPIELVDETKCPMNVYLALREELRKAGK